MGSIGYSIGEGGEAVVRRTYRKSIGVIGVTLLCAAVLTAAVGSIAAVTPSVVTAPLRPIITVDAGHGDFDGGAVAPDGTTEKELNLCIAMPLAVVLTYCGFDVTMTRWEDTSLCEDNSATIRERKVSDMKARLALFEAAHLNISIHQNMFGAAQYHGAQVFYSANHPLSKELGTCVREELYRLVQPDNTRELKMGSRDIYLLYRTTAPTVLVECGFLSNCEELARLQDTEYQRQVAFALACGVMRYEAQWGKESAV